MQWPSSGESELDRREASFIGVACALRRDVETSTTFILPPCKVSNPTHLCSMGSAQFNASGSTSAPLSSARSTSNHLAFLKCCRDTSIIPPGLRLHDPIRNHRSNHILLAASQALLRERISSTGCTLKPLDQQITASETALKSSLQQRDFDKISSFTQSSSLHAFKSSC